MVTLVDNVVELGSILITAPSFGSDPCLAFVVTIVVHSGIDWLQVVISMSSFERFRTCSMATGSIGSTLLLSGIGAIEGDIVVK